MARKQPKKTQLTMPPERPYDLSWGVAGIDVSLTSISGTIQVYDAILGDLRGPAWHSVRWEKSVHFLDRLAEAARAGDFMDALIHAAGPMTIPIANIWVAVEEPWPAGIVKRAESGWLRQQAQVCGAFMGGLVRHGYKRVYEANNQLWKRPIRQETGIGRPDKWDVKNWAIAAYGVPDFPDLIDHSTRGLIPRPETSKAKARQPDDIYDALGIMAWMADTREEEIAPG